MADYIIKVENIGKKYKIRHQQPERYTALRDVIAHKATAPLRWLRDQTSVIRSQKSASNNGNGANQNGNLNGLASKFEIQNPESEIASSLALGSSPDLAPSSLLPASSDLGRLIYDVQPLATEDFWALRGVSFEVKQGEVIGIIGRNGAGKSTLLKILSRITKPTEGLVRLRGRVASLLEVGTGFHPELTGRENIYLNGAILGMARAEIKRQFDEIVAFAEVDKFLDTPVKRYSSGMYVRLAFAVAAHLEPEILVVDEVLAVGDTEFQKKCLGKMQQIGDGGRTVIFVSHNLTAISTLCKSVALLERGGLTLIGSASEVILRYLASGQTLVAETVYSHGLEYQQSSDGTARLTRVRLLDKALSPVGHVQIDEPAFIEITYDIINDDIRPTPIIHITTLSGEKAFASIMRPELAPVGPGKHTVCVVIPPNLLNSTSYVVGVCIGILNPEHTHCEDRESIIFEVLDKLDTTCRMCGG